MFTSRVFAVAVVLGVLAVFTTALAAEIHAGRVLAVADGLIMLRDDIDGDDDLIVVNAETKITRSGKPARLSDIAPGDMARVEATRIDHKLVAKSIDATPLAGK